MDKLIEQIKRHEGFRSRVYKCTAGKSTVGYGHNLEDNDLSERVCSLILCEDLSECLKQLETIPVFLTLNDPRKAALTNMHFNLGDAGLKKFKKMFAALEAQDYAQAAKEMLNSKWAQQVGERATELAEQMERGEWAF